MDVLSAIRGEPQIVHAVSELADGDGQAFPTAGLPRVD